MSLAVTVLGCGSSAGVPVVGCLCEICTSSNPKNNRTRASILIEQGDSSILVDTSPDLRAQCLREGVKEVDGIFITHFHADHVMGIDDIRSFNYHKNAAIPLYCDPSTMANMQHSFGYIFREKAPNLPWYKPVVSGHEVDINAQEVLRVGDVHMQSFVQYHGKMPTAGIRVGDFAYSTDVNSFPEESFHLLEGLDVWLVDCLRYEPAPTHAHLELTLNWIEQFKPKRAILTHMSHQLGYEELMRQLPDHIEVAYDGMKIHI